MKTDMSKTLLIFGILALVVLFAGFASAVATFQPDSISISANPGTQQTFTFNITNEDMDNPLTVITSEVLGFSGIDSNQITINNLPSSIPAQGTIEDVSVTIQIPAQYSAGIHNGNLEVSGEYLISVGLYTLPLELSINETKALSLSTTQALTLTKNATITITNDGNTPLTNVNLILSGGDFEANLSQSNIPQIIAGGFATVTVSPTEDLTNLDLGRNSLSLTATAADGTTSSTAVTFDKMYCEDGEVGDKDDLIIKNVDDRSAGDEWEWAPLKDISLEVDVENTHNDDSKKVTVYIALYNVDEQDFVEIEGDDEMDDTKTISEDDTETYKFEFKLPGDINDQDEYRVYVKAYERGDEELLCTNTAEEFEGGSSNAQYQDITIDFGDEDVLIDNLQLPLFIPCEGTDVISFELYNLQLGDQEDMRIRLANRELGLNIASDTFDLDEGESEEISVVVEIPGKMDEKAYRFTIITDYEFDEDDEEWEDSNEDNTFFLSIQGECTLEAPSIAASLQSGANVDGELSVKVVLTNTEDESIDYTISAEGYEAWANYIGAEPTIVTVAANSVGETTVKLTPTQTGEQTFDIVLTYDSQTVKQPMSVNIKEKSGFITGAFSGLGEGNAAVYVIAIILLVLIIVAVVLIIKFASAGKSSEF
jgi:hypothetical protein